MTVRLNSLSQLPLGVNGFVHVCLSCVSLCCPAMDWRSVQGVPASRPQTEPAPPATLYGRSGYRKWINGWITICFPINNRPMQQVIDPQRSSHMNCNDRLKLVLF
ncbi:hypothetical protein AMECASPLE_008171 [Ameca splendens]|uniref:Secreted protein n=1 Tax=Ameca splendens TaxID=208324 RepID=A0ABV0XCZ8_9TELE